MVFHFQVMVFGSELHRLSGPPLPINFLLAGWYGDKAVNLRHQKTGQPNMSACDTLETVRNLLKQVT
jgi:hypothetical protein